MSDKQAEPPVMLVDAKVGDRVIVRIDLDNDAYSQSYFIKRVDLVSPKGLTVDGKTYWRDGVPINTANNKRLVNPTPEILEAIQKQNERVSQRKQQSKQGKVQAAHQQAELAQRIAHVLLAMDPQTIVSFLSQENLLNIYQNNTVIRNCVEQPFALQPPDGESNEQTAPPNGNTKRGESTEPATG